MQVDHQQTSLPRIPQPLAKHTRSHTEDAEDQDGSHDDLATTPLESSAPPELIPPVEQRCLHRKQYQLITSTGIHPVQQFKKSLHDPGVEMNTF